MKPTTVRLDEATQAQLDAIQASLNATQSETYREIIRFYHAEKIAPKPAVRGWFKRDRPGEIDDRDEADEPPERCLLCGEGIWPASPAWFALVGKSLNGPYCDGCGNSD